MGLDQSIFALAPDKKYAWTQGEELIDFRKAEILATWMWANAKRGTGTLDDDWLLDTDAVKALEVWASNPSAAYVADPNHWSYEPDSIDRCLGRILEAIPLMLERLGQGFRIVYGESR